MKKRPREKELRGFQMTILLDDEEAGKRALPKDEKVERTVTQEKENRDKSERVWLYVLKEKELREKNF